MTDLPRAPEPTEVEIGLAAFLPEGTVLGAADEVADEVDEVGAGVEAGGAPEPSVDLDALDQLERDLDAVDAAIAALDDGTYGIDPRSGEPVDDAVLAEDPTFRA